MTSKESTLVRVRVRVTATQKRHFIKARRHGLDVTVWVLSLGLNAPVKA